MRDLAKKTSQMPNSMIDSVNESYYEQLDDNLIEENENGDFVLNKEYLKLIDRYE